MKRFVGPILILLLTGCASTAPLKTSRSPADFTDWRLNGRVALTHGDRGWHASLLWQEQADGYWLKVSGPLGQGGFQIAGDESGVVLVDDSGRSSHARDADALLLQATGWRLPVNGLRYWIRGLPVPGDEAVEVYNDVGQLSRLEQSGWEIDYTAYTLVEGAAVPSKMRLARDDMGMRLAISEWQLGPPNGSAP